MQSTIMQLKKGEIIELDVHALAFGGAGIGKYEGVTVFVEKTMPGDRVKAALTRIKPKFMEARLVEIVRESKERAKPRCKYSGTCGGCQLQFMPYEKQLEFKKQHVIDSFERIGKIYDPPVKDVVGCKDEFYYRNKMEFSLGYDGGMKFALGLHLPGRRHDILDIDECFLQSERSVEIVNKVREFILKRGWLPFQFSCDQGFLRSLFIREGKRTGDIMINLATSDHVPEDLEKGLEDFAELLKDCDSVYWSKITSRRGHKKEIKEKLLSGKRMITEKMILQNGDQLEFDILPQAFFQVNTHQAEVLYGEVVKLAGGKAHGAIFDLFCGTGTIGLFLAKHGESVFGIDVSEDAIRSARENAMKNKIFNIDFYAGDSAKLVKTLRERPSLIVVDPPRAGLTEKLVIHINDFGPESVIYVSCNPATLARDCQWFARYGYKVKSVQPIDMFPQTYHIENACLLER